MKQAVVVIHGIGEQRPLDTLRGFVAGIADGVVRSKPDRLSESFELRRLSLVETRSLPPTDVYELYWAHHMGPASWGAVLGWVGKLVLRPIRALPPGLRSVALALQTLLLLGFVALAWSAARAFGSGGLGVEEFATSALTYVPVAVAIAQLVFGRVILGYVGDAARYLTPAPENIEARSKIRAEGVRLLRRLHESRDYFRVVVVGHSLGSVIGYDVLRHLWVDLRMPAFDRVAPQPQAEAFEDAVEAVLQPPAGRSQAKAVNLFQQAQHRLWREQRSLGTAWLVTDFITVGSPLAHAELLLEDKNISLDRRKRERELPTCPATSGDEETHFGLNHKVSCPGGPPRFYFRIPNHGAVFASTRWTNLYFPHRRLLLGDVVGGPLAPVFGVGIRDIALRPSKRGFLAKTLASHVLYWEKDPGMHEEDREKRKEIDRSTKTKEANLALRSALQLDAKRSKKKWPAP